TTQMLHYFSELHGNEDIFQQLRLWRREQSSKEGKQPFILASNRVLRMIGTFLPHTKEELLQIPGFGENKTGVYGTGILEITKAHERTTEFPLHWVESVIDLGQFKLWLQRQKELRIKEELDKQANKRKLLEGIERGENLNVIQPQVTISRRDLILWVEELEREGYDVESLIAAELSAVSELEQAAAWTAFAELGDRYLKPVMAKVYKSEEIKGKELDQAYEWLRLLRIRFRRMKSVQPQVKEAQAS
ncbi:MAG TPA: HRDC domain-containing protein, partial [Bacilli bacterium]